MNNGKNPFLETVKRRLRKEDLDWICVIVGPRGIGKSESGGLGMCYYLDKNFNEDNIVFNTEGFLKLLHNKNPKSGSAILLDESGTFMYKREALKKETRYMVKVFEIVRSRNLALILTLPNWSMLDSHCQSMADCLLEGIHRYTKAGLVKFKVKNITINPTKERPKIYYKYPKVNVPGQKKRRTIMHLFLPKAPPTMIRKYRLKKRKSVNEMIKDQLDELERDKVKKNKRLSISKKERIIKELNKGKKNMIKISQDVGCAYDYVRKISKENPNRNNNKEGGSI